MDTLVYRYSMHSTLMALAHLRRSQTVLLHEMHVPTPMECCLVITSPVIRQFLCIETYFDRYIPHMRLPRNGHVVRTRTHTPTYLPPNGHRYVLFVISVTWTHLRKCRHCHPHDWRFTCRTFWSTELGWGFE